MWINFTDTETEALKNALKDELTWEDRQLLAQAVVRMKPDEDHEAYLAAAKEAVRNKEGELEVDDDAVISAGGDPGAYVMAWLWVPNEDAGIPVDDEEEGE